MMTSGQQAGIYMTGEEMKSTLLFIGTVLGDVFIKLGQSLSPTLVRTDHAFPEDVPTPH